MAKLKNHQQFELRDDAAAAFDAYEAKYGIRQVNSARRSVESQQGLINRWDQGGPANRPPYLYPPARPASSSPHVKDGGIAVDIADWRTFKLHSEEFGFYWYGDGDVVHFEFRGWSGHQPTPTPGVPVGNPFGLGDVRGLQKIARLYGGKTELDNRWGGQSAWGFAEFLRKNWGYRGNDVLGPVMWSAIARWLRSRWGYVGNDVPGPVMLGRLAVANERNFAELK